MASDVSEAISAHLFETYGPMIGRRHLYKLLGFSSISAFDRSVSRGRVDLPLFKLPARPGVYVLTPDLVRYLVASAAAQEGCQLGEEEHDRER